MTKPAFGFWLTLAAIVACALILVAAARAPGQCPGGVCPIRIASSFQRVPQSPPAYVGQSVRNVPAPVWRYAAQTGHYKSVVRVEGHVVGALSKKIGSGVCVKWGDKKVIVTAGHVARGCKEVRVYLPASKRWVTAHVVKIDDAWDVSVLVLDAADAAELEAAEIAWGPAATPAVGAKLESCGLGPDGRLAANSGICLGYRGNGSGPGAQADWLELTGRARQGDSGGPVFDESGQLVAVLWGTDDRSVTATQAGYLHQFLAQSLGPWEESGKRKAESGDFAAAAPACDCANPETCLPNGLLSRMKAKSKAPAPQAPQMIVNTDPEVRAGLKEIEGSLDRVAQNTAPKASPENTGKTPEWAVILCVLGGLAVGGGAFLFVQRHP